jgi:hypothetical protein
MDFAFFILLNAVLLIRPEELLPDIAGLRLYLIVICLCLATAGPRVVARLQPSELAERPITVCVLGVWVAGILSHLARGQAGLAIEFAGEFGKVMLYYLLLVSVLDTPNRLRAFLGCLVVIVAVITTLAVLQYHGFIDVEALQPLERKDGYDEETGEREVTIQLRGAGIYNDPNDLCLILVTGSISALAASAFAAGIGRVAWLLPIGLYGYAVTLTQSRGGLLGLMVAGLVCGGARFGWKRTLLAAAAVVPAAMLVLGGRQANISLGSEDTAHSRVALWSDGLVEMMRNPVTGIGPGEYVEEAGMVAHNSFVHAYVELGLLGGTLFLGAFALGAVGLYRAVPAANPTLARLRPFVLAIVVGYAGGIFSLSRNYVVPTYMILGLADAYLRVALPVPPGWLRFDGRMAGRLAIVGVAGLVGLKLLTQVLLSLGG